MWLYIHRPFEVWSWLGEYRIERVYMIVTMVAGAMSGKLTLPTDRLSCAFVGFLFAMFAAWMFSPYPVPGERVVEDYLKVAVFYVLVVSVCRSEKDLRFIVTAFLVCMALYMGHSFREYLCGRMVWRMGTARMIGVDTSYGDPNTFAASILYSLPMLIPFWLDSPTRRTKALILGYLALALTCILLTGSRTAFAMTLLIGAPGMLMLTKRKMATVLVVVVVAMIAWGMLPEDRRMRFMTLIDPSVGPANAQVSGESREIFFHEAQEVWQQYPLFGVGPGAFGVVRGHGMQTHTLYGQLIAELGSFGVITFVPIVLLLGLNYWEARGLAKRWGPDRSRFPLHVTLAVAVTVILLLAMGVGGHNLFRYTWMWFGGFQLIALRILRGAARQPVVMAPPRLALRGAI